MGFSGVDASRVIGQSGFAAAALFVLASVWPADPPSWLVPLVLVLISPLVGDFSATMAARYAPCMDWRACFARLAAPSKCDRCGVALSQFDMLPLVSPAALSGKCSCGSYDVPRSYGLWSGISLAGVLALFFVGWLNGDLGSSAAPMGMLLAMMPSIANDSRHGEVDPGVLALGLVGSVCSGILSIGVSAALVGLVAGSVLIAAAAGAAWMAVSPSLDGCRPFPIGVVDVAVAGGACSILRAEGIASFLVWCVPAAIVAVAVVALTRGGGRYGPAAGFQGFAFPLVPVIVGAACAAALLPVV